MIINLVKGKVDKVGAQFRTVYFPTDARRRPPLPLERCYLS